MRLVLIGDIHTFTLKVHPRRLLSRRVMGQSNLWLNRQFRFNHLILDRISEKVDDLNPDMLLFSGDVTTTSLEDEFLDVERYLRPLSDRYSTVLVPGNHDRYTFRSKHLRRIETLLEGILPGEWPHYEELNARWRLLALDSAMPQWMMSRGALGPTQLEGARDAVAQVRQGEGLLVLCHYPVATPSGIPSSWAHALAEEKELRQILSDCAGRVVFLHGHIHKPWHWGRDADVEDLSKSLPVNRDGKKKAPFTCINAGAPCMTSGTYPLGQGFWEIILPEEPKASLHLTHHVPLPTGDRHATGPLRRRSRRRSLPDQIRWEARRVL